MTVIAKLSLSAHSPEGLFLIAFGSKVENHEADLGETLLKAICHHKSDIGEVGQL